MAKITITDVASLTDEQSALSRMSTTNAAITAAFNNTLSLDGTSPNSMEADLDLNSNDLLNAGTVNCTELTVGGLSVDSSVTAAAASAAAALVSQTSAASSATTSATSATNAATSATTSATSATNSATSATASAASATVASNAATSYPGYKYTWSTNTSSSDPTTGVIKVNNATPSSATAIYISETDANSNGIAAVIATFDDSTSSSKARVRIVKNATNFVEYNVTGSITDNGTWDSLTVSNITSSGSFSNGDVVYIFYNLVGDAGSGSVSGMASHGIPLAGSATAISSSIALTDGQLIVGQTGADPLAKTVTGDVTIAASGATTVAKIAGVAVSGTTGTVNNVFSTSPTLTTPILGVATATSINKMAITAPATSSTLAVADGKTATISNTLTFSGTDSSTLAVGVGGTLTGSSSSAIFYDNIPQNSKSAAYTTVLADAQKHIYHPSADTTARIWTIDSNANVAYPIGTAITFVNDTSAGVLTIAITTDTLILAGAGTTGSRTLAANGIATAIKMTSTRWMISGTGLT